MLPIDRLMREHRTTGLLPGFAVTAADQDEVLGGQSLPVFLSGSDEERIVIEPRGETALGADQ